jgi:hypothetical protein
MRTAAPLLQLCRHHQLLNLQSIETGSRQRPGQRLSDAIAVDRSAANLVAARS